MARKHGDRAALFQRFARIAADKLGTYWAFLGAAGAVVVWAALGPVFDFSDRWELVINTGTTIITFLMVFLIQATQNRDAKATSIKLDELIRATRARNKIADIEDASEEELEHLTREFERLRKGAAAGTARGRRARH